MKNIHILQTDKSSRLYRYKDKLGITNGFQLGSETILLQHICITSNENINEDDWCTDGKTIFQVSYILADNIKQANKIILTTDQELIKNGVQAIDDEFLQWFVNNPSCEEVEIEDVYKTFLDEDKRSVSNFRNKYKTIIPKEESFKHTCRVLTTEEVMAGRSSAYEFIDFDKQETLEEAAEKCANESNCYDSDKVYWGFEEGAKWQQERMYSEEEMVQYSDYVLMCSAEKTLKIPLTPKEWFEQFKKK